MFDGALRIAEQPRPVPGSDEVLIRPRLMGICNTDLELTRGYKGFAGTLGHEFVGDVIEGPADWIGRRVVGEINIACGECDLCRRDMPTHCRQRSTLGIMNYDGAFADLFRLPVRNLLSVPDAVSDEAAVFTEPLAAACQVLESARIRPSDRVALIGAGKLGMLVAQVVRLSGADLSVIIRRDRQADLLAGWGIRAVRRDTVPDNRADVVIDCTGSADGFAESLALVRPRGTVVLKSTYAGMPQADLTQIVVDEIRVVGSRCGPFDAALRLLEQSLVEPRALIDACYELTDAVTA
ncbi:MAG: alcohol dehydrogenase catalytic domain-containing protein, partial [Anaerolineae bacterium]|nr:alcohol dehydrogenase catalytic domain-containing protein [Anaerolineae bacterium]